MTSFSEYVESTKDEYQQRAAREYGALSSPKEAREALAIWVDDEFSSLLQALHTMAEHMHDAVSVSEGDPVQRLFVESRQTWLTMAAELTMIYDAIMPSDED